MELQLGDEKLIWHGWFPVDWKENGICVIIFKNKLAKRFCGLQWSIVLTESDSVNSACSLVRSRVLADENYLKLKLHFYSTKYKHTLSVPFGHLKEAVFQARSATVTNLSELNGQLSIVEQHPFS